LQKTLNLKRVIFRYSHSQGFRPITTTPRENICNLKFIFLLYIIKCKLILNVVSTDENKDSGISLAGCSFGVLAPLSAARLQKAVHAVDGGSQCIGGAANTLPLGGTRAWRGLVLQPKVICTLLFIVQSSGPPFRDGYVKQHHAMGCVCIIPIYFAYIL
jgi:hypothetical protein